MRIVIISDTHNRYPILPDGDILIHCGDFAESGHEYEIDAGLVWFNKQSHQYKIFIAGNHDKALQHPEYEKEIRETYPNLIYLKDEAITINGINFYGTPWSSLFFHWAFMLDQEDRRTKWEQIPVSTDILITHTPPYGILDKVGTEYTGCSSLLDRVKIIQPKYHCFGHIHECRNIEYRIIPETMFINASHMNYITNTRNKAFSIEYETGEIIDF